MAFDIGILLANFWMAYFSQRGHEEAGSRDDVRRYLLTLVSDTWAIFSTEFTHLWRTERTGMLYDRQLFEERGDVLGAEQALTSFLHQLWVDALGFAGLECHRRILGLAHNAEFETIENLDARARSETNVLKFGRHLIVNRALVRDIGELNDLAARLDCGALS